MMGMGSTGDISTESESMARCLPFAFAESKTLEGGSCWVYAAFCAEDLEIDVGRSKAEWEGLNFLSEAVEAIEGVFETLRTRFRDEELGVGKEDGVVKELPVCNRTLVR